MAESPETTSDEKDKPEGAGKKKGIKFPSFENRPAPASTQDPLLILMEIAKEKEIDDEMREWLLQFSMNRFKNRRKMAYASLMTIIAIIIFLGIAALIDGIAGYIGACAGACVGDEVGILYSISRIDSLLTWVVGFLSSIVGAYFGVASFRPSS